MSIFDGISSGLDGVGVSFTRESAAGRKEDLDVFLTAEQVHDALIAASQAVVRPGATPRVENGVTVHRQTNAAGTWGTTVVDVRLIENMLQLIGEICDLAAAPVAAHRYYRFGEWILELQTGDGYYIETYGNTGQVGFGNWDTDTKSYVLGSNYSKMMENGSFQTAEAAGFARDWHLGKPLLGVTAGTANTVVAMLISEALRNHRTYLINLMCLDLVDWNIVKWSELPDKYHPMARGGTYERGTTGFAGGEKDVTTRLFEKVIAMQWLARVEWSEEISVYSIGPGILSDPLPDQTASAALKLKNKLVQRAYKAVRMPKKT